ncbi:hypothetical protein SK803_38155 [Lentzea sp. BCCO 10_0856]|uniref:DUF3592 domain-containing protein n=1 Tax=Lentzea miocenica TaxID=3095431 RepID=A0ABU4TDT6_9PSEU|nr:hypothetical protein [Lentzea sp. BCCO 10_0856]MDX8036053.1 hypothetical protein [Lentzea sp. BCCO 10_0856]
MAEPRRGIAGVAIAAGILMMLFQAEAVVVATKVTFDLGTPGVYLFAEEPSCGGRSRATPCSSWDGTFTSDDGKVTRAGVGLAGQLPKGFAKGDSVRAFEVGDPNQVYSPEAKHGDMIWMYYMMGGMGLLAVVLGSCYLWWYRNHD